MTQFTDYVDLAAARLGGRALIANDEFFAEKENLLKPEAPVFIADKYTDRGKWMDGWESRRRRTSGHDWCIVRLGIPGIIKGIVVDTSFFTGNFPSHCSLDGCTASSDADPGALAQSEDWREILPRSELKGDTPNAFTIAAAARFTHVRLNIYPDGGVARLRVHGDPVPDWTAILQTHDVVNVSAIEHGGRALDSSDRFYSHPQNLLMPYRAANMGDGWETKRRRGPGHDWAILRLGVEAEIRRIELDTTHFKGNYPDSCSVDATTSGPDPNVAAEWTEVLSRTELGPDATHIFDAQLRPGVIATHVRLNMFPDGGVSRLRIFGTPTRVGLARERVRAMNAMTAAEAERALKNCCGSSAWVSQMAASRPFADAPALLETADSIWNSLSPDAWRDAFTHHPRIGDRNPAAGQSARAHAWSGQEQSRAQAAPAATLAALAEGNREYERRFGYVFVVCAMGKSSEEILAQLRERLVNDAATELPRAAAEQAQITRLRLERLLTGR